MRFTELFIRRPVLASMVSLALVLVGVIGYGRLPVREFPDADAPVVSVTVVLPGASPQVVESAVTDVLEEELSSVEGVRTLTSSSQEQVSTITLEFNLERDIEAAAQDVRDRVARVRWALPEDIEEPVVAKEDADAFPVMFLALTSKSHSLMELSDLADREIKPRLQTIPGVSGAPVMGERRFAMRVWLSPRELAARGLTAQDVEQAIRSRSIEVPAGRIESDRREFPVRYLGEVRTAEEFAELAVRAEPGRLVKLGDVARVEPGPEDERSITRYAGEPAVFVGVVRQSKSNVVEVARAVQGELPAVRRALPAGVELHMAFDGSVFVERSIREARETLVVTAVLVILIIFLFLATLRATVIPALAIPVSIIATFAVLAALGYSVNSLTLLGLILAIGIVVDDAIIVMENAYRHQEELGKDPLTAAIDGTREITTAVIATVLALLAVFSPLLFLTGATGRLFTEFGVAVGGAVLVSGIVALTLTPMLSARILRVEKRESRFHHAVGRVLSGVAARYARLLGRAVRHPWRVVGAGAAVTAASVLLFASLEREFVPSEDRGFFFTFVVGPEGASVDYTDEYMRQAEAAIHATAGVRSSFSVVGGFMGPPSSGLIGPILEDWEERDRSAEEIIAEVQPKLFFGVPGVFAFASNPPAFGGWMPPVQFVVKHRDFEALVDGMEALVARASAIPGLVNVDTDLRVTKPELVVALDRDRAEDLGVPARDVALALQTLLGGRDVSRFTSDNELYDVILRLDPAERATPSDIAGLHVRGRDGALVPLDALTRIEERVGPRQLNHHDRVRSFTLSASLAPGFTLGAALDSLNAAAAEVLPPGASIDLAGESREFRESGSALYFAFALALVFVFMVLAAQYESLVHPFTVLLAVPLAVAGALAALWLARSTLNVYSQVGMILLIGLVSKNSILLVTYANDLRARGRAAAEAMVEAGRIRLRPILMTSVATIFGAVPIALGLGAGASSRRPLGYAIIGGMIVSTLITLFLVPAVFVVLERARARRTARAAAGAPEPVPAPKPAPVAALLALLALATPATAQQPANAPVNAPANVNANVNVNVNANVNVNVNVNVNANVNVPVSLPEARRLAAAIAPAAVAARAELSAAGWERRAALADVFTPRIAATTGFTRFSDPFFNFGTGEITGNATSATLEASYTLFGAGKWAALRRSAAAVTAAEAGDVVAAYRVALDTDLAYYTVLADAELARVAADRLRRAEEQLGFARVRVQAGEAIAADSLRIVLEVTRARVEVLRRDSALAVSRLRLGRLIGVAGPVDAAPIEGDVPPELPLTLEEAMAELRTSGPELLAARAVESSTAAALAAEREAYLPSVVLSATMGAYDSGYFPSALRRDQFSIALAWPLWNGGQREVAIARARARHDVARAERAERERAAADLMTEAFAGYRTARAGIELARTGGAVAAENYRVQLSRYREGATTILDLLEAQVALGEAEAELVRARHAARLALARTESLLGRRLFDNDR